MSHLVAVVAALGAGIVRYELNPLWGTSKFTFITFYPAIALAAWLGGLGPGLVACGVSVLCTLLLLEPGGSLWVHNPNDLIAVALFASIGIFISYLSEGLHRARRHAEVARDAARESEKRLRGIVASATDAIISIDADQRITLFNTGAETVFGYSAEEMIGRTLDPLIPERFREVHRGHIAAFGATGVSTRAMGGERVLAGVRRNGDEFPMEARISQIEVAGERLFTVILRDITARKQAEAQREALLASAERSRAEAEHASQAKDAFLATISHELRTPLSPILTWARMLRGGMLDDTTAAQALETIERSAQAQAQLIEDLLDVSRIVAGKLRLDVRPVELASVVQAALDVVRAAAEAKNIRLQVVLDPAAGRVSGDPERLQQVVWNLLSNAIKFTPKGGRIQVVLERVNSHVEIAVSDTGQGIPRDFLPHVFERFQQAEEGSDRTHSGLGLGLAIVRNIVELHGGTVHAESPGIGQGAVFTIKLPLIVIARTAGEAERRHPLAAQDVASDQQYARLDGLRVLVVDDEPDSNESVRVLLSTCGAEVRVAASAELARELLRRWRTDLIVSDVGMPGEDGYKFIASLRAQDGETRSIPAVALTAYASRDDKIRLLSAGFQAHVPKPLDPAELITVVASLAKGIGR